MDKEDVEAAVWRLQHFINDGVGDDVPKDICTLLAHIADLEDELRAAKTLTPRDNAGGTESRGVGNGTIAIDAYGCAWARRDPGCWFPLRVDVDSEVIELPEIGGPYAIVYTPVYTPKEES